MTRVIATVLVALLSASAPSFAQTTTPLPTSVFDSLDDRREIVETLAGMAAFDQLQRRTGVAVMNGLDEEERAVFRDRFSASLRASDVERAAFVKGVIATHGWPTPAMFGEEASFGAWIIVQHADHDPAFQAEVLELISPLVTLGEVDAQSYALLFDRVAVAQNRPQRYATQIRDCEGGRRIPPTALENPEAVDERRASVGLGPLSDYIAMMDRRYGACTAEPARGN